MNRFTFRRITGEDAGKIAGWRYDGPYSLYDINDSAHLLRPEYEYYAAVAEEGGLVGYCCFGADARVPGLVEEAGVLDVGAGLRPDLTGIGLGGPFLREVCRLGAEVHDPARLRVTIAAFNRRAQLVAAALGFERTGSLENPQGEYVVMSRPA